MASWRLHLLLAPFQRDHIVEESVISEPDRTVGANLDSRTYFKPSSPSYCRITP